MFVLGFFTNQPVFAAESESPLALKCEQYSLSTWPAVAAGKAAADCSARRRSGKPEWHCGASPAGTDSEKQGHGRRLSKHGNKGKMR